MNTREYETIINNTVVPSSLTNEQKNLQYDAIDRYVNSLLPKKLYRFRSCSERHLSAFYRDELWFSNGSVMNDDFDARLYYDKEKINKWLDKEKSEYGVINYIKHFLQLKDIPDDIKKNIPNSENTFNMLKGLRDTDIGAISKQLISFASGNISEILRTNTIKVQSVTKFACFSESINSDMMWGNYSDNATGFALEYEFNKQIIGFSNNGFVHGALYPVLYGNKRVDATDYAIFLFQNAFLSQIASQMEIYLGGLLQKYLLCPDEFMSTKLAIIKSNDWKSEKEWRLVFSSNIIRLNSEAFVSVPYKPSAVYLGRKISEFNKKIILDIAREKNIPAFQMDIDENSDKYSMKKRKLI